jgi:hypothetical protein
MGVLSPDQSEFDAIIKLNPLRPSQLAEIYPFLKEDPTSLASYGLHGLINLLMAPLYNSQHFLCDHYEADNVENTLSGGFLAHSHTALRDMLHLQRSPLEMGWFFDRHSGFFSPLKLADLAEILYVCNEAFGTAPFLSDHLNHSIVPGHWEGSLVGIAQNDQLYINRHQCLTPRPDNITLNLLGAIDVEGFLQHFMPENVRYGIGSARQSTIFDSIYNALLGAAIGKAGFIYNYRVGAGRYYTLKLAEGRYLSINKLTGFICRMKPSASKIIFGDTLKNYQLGKQEPLDLKMNIFALNQWLYQQMQPYIEEFRANYSIQNVQDLHVANHKMMQSLFEAEFIEIRLCTAEEADEPAAPYHAVMVERMEPTLLNPDLTAYPIYVRLSALYLDNYHDYKYPVFEIE